MGENNEFVTEVQEQEKPKAKEPKEKKSEKQTTKKEKSEVETKIEALREKMKSLTKKDLEWSNLNTELQDLLLKREKEKTKKANHRLLERAKKAAEAKRDAILKNFFEDGLSTENEMKLLLIFRKVLAENGITTEKELREHFVKV